MINTQLSSLARGLPVKPHLMRYTANPSRDNLQMMFGQLLFPSAFAHCLRNGSKAENLLCCFLDLLALMLPVSTPRYDLWGGLAHQAGSSMLPISSCPSAFRKEWTKTRTSSIPLTLLTAGAASPLETSRKTPSGASAKTWHHRPFKTGCNENADY